jgi:hypothetical protein
MTSKAAQTAGKGAAALPLIALLSQVLVAFTIEADNELEHGCRTGRHAGSAASSRRGPPRPACGLSKSGGLCRS